MLKDLTDRVLEEGYYIAQTGATVRKTAEIFHFSKSTVHKDVTERLSLIDKDLAEKVRAELERQVALLPREEIARTSIDNNGKIIK